MAVAHRYKERQVITCSQVRLAIKHDSKVDVFGSRQGDNAFGTGVFNQNNVRVNFQVTFAQDSDPGSWRVPGCHV